jgi:hypothetical protein
VVKFRIVTSFQVKILRIFILYFNPSSFKQVFPNLPVLSINYKVLCILLCIQISQWQRFHKWSFSYSSFSYIFLLRNLGSRLYHNNFLGRGSIRFEYWLCQLHALHLNWPRIQCKSLCFWLKLSAFAYVQFIICKEFPNRGFVLLEVDLSHVSFRSLGAKTADLSNERSWKSFQFTF